MAAIRSALPRRLAAAWLVGTACAGALADVRYDMSLSSGQWYTAVGNAHSASKPYGPSWPVPMETEQYTIDSRGAKLETNIVLAGELAVGRLLSSGAATVVATPSGTGFSISGGSGGSVRFEWLDFLNVMPTALRDADGFLRIPWSVDYSGKIEIEGMGADARTGATATMRLSALAWPYSFNVLGYTSPTFTGLEFVQEYRSAEGVSIYDVASLPINPYTGVIAIPPGITQVRLEGSMHLEIGAGAPGAGNFTVTAEQPRPFRFYLDRSELALGQIVQSTSGANYAIQTPVPEPATWTTMLVGLLVLEAARAARMRQQTAAATTA